MAAPNFPGWQAQILTRIGAPVTPSNLQAFHAWTQAEAGTAANNPFNTTRVLPSGVPFPGATPYNTIPVSSGPPLHVWQYASPQQGINATVQTLKNGYYQGILNALRAGSNAMAVARAVDASGWGTQGMVNYLHPGV